MKFWLLAIVVLSGSACVNASKITDGKDFGEPQMAHLVSYELSKGFMTIRVLTSGCTGMNSFKVVADKKIDNGVKVLRIKQDNCRLKTRPIELQYSIRHLGVDIRRAVSVLNVSNDNQQLSNVAGESF